MYKSQDCIGSTPNFGKHPGFFVLFNRPHPKKRNSNNKNKNRSDITGNGDVSSNSWVQSEEKEIIDPNSWVQSEEKEIIDLTSEIKYFKNVYIKFLINFLL